jgi:hypothetical protein
MCRTILLASCGLFALASAAAQAQQPAPADDAPLSFRVDSEPLYLGQIEELKRSGAARLGLLPDQPPGGTRADLTEGYYLAVVVKDPSGLEGGPPRDAQLARVNIVETLDGGRALAQFGKEAAPDLRAGMAVALIRPRGATTAQLKAAPELVPLSFGDKDSPGAAGAAQAQVLMANNLRQVGLALHNFHDANNGFPPAVILGRDGKPWHSWRVLILPYLDQQALYEQYRWDEPWNGPNNRKLLASIPDVYRDPLAESDEATTTPVVAITGAHAAFSDEGAAADEEGRFAGGGRKFFDITDGTSNTILVGLASADEAPPWMKPEDIVIDRNFPGIGQPGGLGAPFTQRDRASTVALFCDGSVHVLGVDVALDVQQALLSADGAEIVDPSALGGGGAGGGQRSVAFIEIVEDADGVRAVVVQRAVEEEGATFEGVAPAVEEPRPTTPRRAPPPERRE